MIEKTIIYPFRSYENIDPMEVGDTDHVLRVNGEIKAQISTETDLEAIIVDGGIVRLHLSKIVDVAPTEWPKSTKIQLIFRDALLEPNPVSPDARIEDIDNLRGIEVSQPEDSRIANGFPKLVVLTSDQSVWNLYYKEAEVIANPA